MSNRRMMPATWDYRLEPPAEVHVPEQGCFRMQFDLDEVNTHNAQGEEIPVVECVVRWSDEDGCFAVDKFHPRAWVYMGARPGFDPRRVEPMSHAESVAWERVFDKLYDLDVEFQRFVKAHAKE